MEKKTVKMAECLWERHLTPTQYVWEIVVILASQMKLNKFVESAYLRKHISHLSMRFTPDQTIAISTLSEVEKLKLHTLVHPSVQVEAWKARHRTNRERGRDEGTQRCRGAASSIKPRDNPFCKEPVIKTPEDLRTKSHTLLTIQHERSNRSIDFVTFQTDT